MTRITKFNNKTLFKSGWGRISTLVLLMALLAGCSKQDGGNYSYVNKAHIFDGNALEYLASKPGLYDSLLLVLSRFPDIEDSVKTAEVTLAAPTNRSFEIAMQNLNNLRRIQKRPQLTLSTVDSTQLDTIVSRYILRGQIHSADVIPYVDGIPGIGIKYGIEMNLQYQKTSAAGAVGAGPQLLYISDTKGSPFIQFWIRTTTTSVDLITDNAIIHTLVPDHEFGYGEFSKRLNN